jgi:hypothetical protein
MVVALAAFLMRPAPADSRPQFGGSNFQVNSYTTDAQWYPAVAGDSNGNFVVVWASRFQDPDPGSIADVYGQRYDSSGARLGPEFRVNTYTTEGQFRPVVTAAPDGTVVSAWVSHSQDGSASGVFARLFDSDGNVVGDEFQVNEFADDAQEFPEVATNAEGSFMAVWHSRKPVITGSVEVFARVFDSTGLPLGPEFQINDYTTRSQLYPKVCAGESDDFVVVWQSGATLDSSTEQDGSGAGVFGRKFDSAGLPLGPEFQVAQYATNSQVNPAVACAPGGDFVVSWSGYGPSGSGDEVFARHFTSETVPTSPQLQLRTLPTPTVSPIKSIDRQPRVARGLDGSYLVVWADRLKKSVGTGEFDIVGQFLRSDGSQQLGANFVVTTYPNALNWDPVVSSSGDGFVIAWTSGDPNYTRTDTQDGSGAGVFAREVRRVPDCGDVTDDGRVAATDALVTLTASVGTGPCELCVCDTDASGELTATDALAILRNAVGLAAPLQCENC